MECARCGAPTAEMFLGDGSQVCRLCFNTADTGQRELRAVKSAGASGCAGIAIAVMLLPLAIFGRGLLKLTFLVFLIPGIASLRWSRQKKRQLAAETRA